MNRFRLKTAEQISEHELIAYHLHELSSGRARLVRRAIEQDAALAAEAAAIERAMNALKSEPMPVGQDVLDRNWAALRPSLRTHAAPQMRPRSWRGPLVAGGLLAGAAGVAFLLSGPSGPSGPSGSRQAAEPHGSGLVQGGGAASSLAGETPSEEETFATPSEPSAKAKLGGGVYRPDVHRPDAAIHLLEPARAPQIAELAPPLPLSREPLSREPVAMAGPLTVFPVDLIPAPTPAATPAGAGSFPVPRVTGGQEGRHRHVTDLMLGVGGNLIVPHHSLTAGTEPRSQTATHAILAVGAFHQQFRRALGYRITASYSRPEFDYTYSTGVPGGFSESGKINSRVFELAGTYVVEGPHRGRLTTSADAGGGLMAFLPTTPNPTVNYVYRGAGLLGVNLDVALTKHLGARLAYRAQIFKGPDFRYDGGSIPVTTSVTESNEPSLGITYRFGK